MDDPTESIHDAGMTCPACGWAGKVYDCTPDIDGDGGLGCPKCKAVAKMADAPAYPPQPAYMPTREQWVALVKAARAVVVKAGTLEITHRPNGFVVISHSLISELALVIPEIDV